MLGTLSWTTAAVYVIRDVDMSPLQLVLAGTALEVAYFLFEVPTGVVADLYSRKVSIVIGAVVSGIAMIVIGALPQVGYAIAGMAGWGAGWTFRSGAEDAWLADELGSGEWTGGPTLGAVGTRWGIRSALVAGALQLAPTLLLLGRAVRHHGKEPELVQADA